MGMCLWLCLKNNMFDKLYAAPLGRLARRFVVVGLSAVVPVFFSKVGVDPFTLVDNVLALSRGDFEMMGKLFIAAGFLASVDKLRREWPEVKLLFPH